jgi:glutamine cyclotransferase
VAALLWSCSEDPAGPGRPSGPIVSDDVPLYTYRILNTYPHDRGAFTQDLVWADSVLFESTGLYRESSLREVELETGQVLRRRNLNDQYFAEGLTLWEDVLVQLTWREHKAFVYARDSFTPIGEFDYVTQGWGLTHDGSSLIMSDGRDSLYFRDPETFARQKTIPVRDAEGEPVYALNELEYIDDRVFANVWMTDWIAVIDPQDGQVRSWIDLSGLLTPEEASRADVLNGIAFDPVARRLFVTGKDWPKLFEIELIPAMD